MPTRKPGTPPKELRVYVAASFRHKHGVRLLCARLRELGWTVLDWTEKAVPPPGLTPLERRQWMDTDTDGGQVYAFCRDACLGADLVIYYGASGQDAGVEVGLAAAAGVPVLGLRGPLEGPGLMVHGAVSAWADSAEALLDVVTKLGDFARGGDLPDVREDPAAHAVCQAYRRRCGH
ncbi:MAG: translation initiation factor 2 [Desulfovibrio sp.]|nr:translation initiation factor 2 [Desulfovibrio sp.]